MNDPRREPWLERSLALLDDSLGAIDSATLTRLNQARQQALAQRHWQRQRRLRLGLGALGATAMLLLGLGLGRQLQPPPATTAATVASADALLAGEDSVELYADLDFYAWLDARQDGELD